MPFRFALSGHDDKTHLFCRAAIQRGHQCIAYVESSEDGIGNPEFAQNAMTVNRIETLGPVEYLVIGGTARECGVCLEHALAGPWQRLVMATPCGLKPESLHELKLAQLQSGVQSLFLCDEFEHPAVLASAGLLADERMGAPRWMELTLPLDPTKGPIHRFLPGWTIVRQLAGEVLSVATNTPGQAAEKVGESLEQAAVTFETDRGVLGTARYIAGCPSVAVRIETTTGSLEFRLNGDLEGPSEINWKIDADAGLEAVEADDRASRWFGQWNAVLQGNAAGNMEFALRQFQIADGIERSLKRRRPVAIDQEELSESAGFKSVMTTWGCGLIWLTLLIAILAAAGVPFVKHLVLPALALFLASQLLGLLVRNGNSAAPVADDAVKAGRLSSPD